MSGRDIRTLLGAAQAMLEQEEELVRALEGESNGVIAEEREKRRRARQLLAAHLYLMLGHLQSSDRGNVEDALAQIRELAVWLKEPA